MVKIRSILDKLIYYDKYSIIDRNMSPSNIGGRKERNIRDHLFVINAILQDIKLNKNESVDVRKCFDKMWSSEKANDFYEAGVNDDIFVLVANSNQSCKIAIKTPWGSLTPRIKLKMLKCIGGCVNSTEMFCPNGHTWD